MANLLPNLVNNLAEGIHKIKCKYGHDDNFQKVKLLELNIKIANPFLNTQTLKIFNRIQMFML